jgi:SAM-dependent methyltransferase
MDTVTTVTPNVQGPPCKLCGHLEGSLKIHIPAFTFVSGDFAAPPWQEHDKYYCPSCQFLWSPWLDNKTQEEYGREYVRANYDHQRRPTESRMVAAPHLIQRLLVRTRGTRFLDYGVGYNTPYIYELRARGIDVWGCDISATVPYSRFIRYLPANDLPKGTYDGIYSLDVAEHLADIITDYERMKNLLRPGGMILHSTLWLHNLWDGKSTFPQNPMLWNPWHVSICSSRTMQVIAERTGLEYLGTLRLPTDTGQGYILSKPGQVDFLRQTFSWFRPRFWSDYCRIKCHYRYVGRTYF